MYLHKFVNFHRHKMLNKTLHVCLNFTLCKIDSKNSGSYFSSKKFRGNTPVLSSSRIFQEKICRKKDVVFSNNFRSQNSLKRFRFVLFTRLLNRNTPEHSSFWSNKKLKRKMNLNEFRTKMTLKSGLDFLRSYAEILLTLALSGAHEILFKKKM